MLVEAAWAAARAPGPLRAFFLRVRARRGQHVAAVATARKLAVVIWHLLTKRRELRLGSPVAARQEAARPRTQGRAARLHAARRVQPTPTTSRATAKRSGAGSSRPRRLMPASSPAGTREGRRRRARAPQVRSDDRGCAAGLSPQALLFATRSPVRNEKIAQIHAKSSCRSHQWLGVAYHPSLKISSEQPGDWDCQVVQGG